ncbi:16S rRNA (guanine(966)-N(2))-methyltransferase RsmD [Cytobacillus sp. S13-E01]|uniref:16S rRNA (guanine(966)-N(2))-methyltransferase RsmD n=1 Tax=Cytobacillus sp. S13-E01 TaxID=3031326 RepID=UPI0023D8820A|nr:16S rRNA (guanine(966)-N(2))-methyltransferase RsmD [Cytobacillus sp. S13-E01]MDF0725304.1 16S rRNA (guanine(966)-N(2))-methyltransferase RsmD [Cytobacillus sp. S13-E01]
MRVVSGTCKGRPLKAVSGVTTRPTTDKVKEAIFNIVGPYFDGGTGLDLFGGSGGLGIEALSRGLDHMIFVDRDQKAIQTIRANVEACRFSDKVEIYRNDAERALKAIIKRDLQFNLIFLDPPYKKQQLNELIEKIHYNKLLSVNGFIVAEHSEEVQLSETIGTYTKIKHENYGVTSLSVYKFEADVEGGQ